MCGWAVRGAAGHPAQGCPARRGRRPAVVLSCQGSGDSADEARHPRGQTRSLLVSAADCAPQLASVPKPYSLITEVVPL